MKEYKAYLFDFDYTLADSSSGITLCFHRTCAELGCRDWPDEKLLPLIGMPMREAIAAVIGDTDDDAISRFHDAYRKIADREMTRHTHFYPDTLPVLRSIKGHGSHAAVISTKTRARIMEKFDGDHVAGLIDFVIGCEDVTELKPSPEGILLAISRLQIAREDAIYVGDSLYDANAAANAGIDFAAVLTGTTPAGDFAPLPHVAIMARLGELMEECLDFG